MENDPFKDARRLIAEWDAAHQSNGHAQEGSVNWPNLRDMEFMYDWLVERFWPKGAHIHVFAAAKTGKSLLMLWVAGNIALGRDPFTWEPIERQRVAYFDYEMTLKDLRDRVVAMEFDFDALQDWLFYFPYPQLAPMDT